MLQPLVIEDEDDLKDVYQGIFDTISAEISNVLPFAIMPPCYAFSFDEAKELLAGSKIFHVVILDLRLPESSDLPELQGQDLGLELLEKCIDR